MHMRRCVSFMGKKTFLKPSAVLFTSVSMHDDIVVFSASDLRRTPSSHNLLDFESLLLSTQFFQLNRDGSSWVDPEIKQGLVNGSCSRTQGSDAGNARTRNPSVSCQVL